VCLRRCVCVLIELIYLTVFHHSAFVCKLRIDAHTTTSIDAHCTQTHTHTTQTLHTICTQSSHHTHTQTHTHTNTLAHSMHTRTHKTHTTHTYTHLLEQAAGQGVPARGGQADARAKAAAAAAPPHRGLGQAGVVMLLVVVVVLLLGRAKWAVLHTRWWLSRP